MKNGTLRKLDIVAKRCLDIFLALTLIILLIPVFIAIAIAIKVTSKGPIIYKQERIGEDRRNGDRRRQNLPFSGPDRRKGERRKLNYAGRPFKMYKFRSMVVDAEKLQPALIAMNEASGPLFKIKDDPRVTKVGKFLRRWSLDELPQLFNVLKGDMSLVGPRPALQSEIDLYEPWQKERLKVKQGLTGLWQVSGRSNLPFSEMVKLDIYYVRHRSIIMDLKILLKTLPAVLKRDGAY